MKRIYKAVTARIPAVWLWIIVAALVAGGFWMFSGGEEVEQTLLVERGEFVQEVSVSGKVVAANTVDLAFSETGRIGSIRIKVGDRVSRGQVVASLDIDTLASDLRAARVDLEEVTREENAQVASAYRNLFSEGLAAVPNSSSNTAEPPVITGLYEGVEGTYRIRIEKKINSADYELRTFNLETTGPIIILDDEPTSLGTRGLFIQFPEALAAYNETIWNVAIPNQKSTEYLSNYNAYQEALRSRERALANAQTSIDNIETDIAQRTLRAPFAGVVTAIETDEGAIVSSNDIVLSLIGADTLQIESFVPEINLSLVKVGTPAVVTLDAYGDEVPFLASVVSVDPAETIRDGVSTYRAVLQFTEQDERIRSGMTANVRITADRREDVIAIPQGAVESREGKKYVRVKVGEDVAEREVTVGALSSLGSIEILTGLEEGEVIVISN